MRIKSSLQTAMPDLLVVLGFLIVSYVYFLTPLSHDWVLGGHDVVAGIGQGQEQLQHLAQTGERTRWTNSMFSGMPTYQISPSYGPSDLLSKIGLAIGLFTTGPLNYLFLYLLGFYILMRTLGNKALLSAFGAAAWAFSSYFLIIIAAGHIWKVNTLAFIPPTIAGLIMAYRGRYLWGGLTLALFAALQILSNHIQMTYYFLFVMLFVVVGFGIEAICRKQWKRFLKASITVLTAGTIAALINLPNLYHTWQYSKQSMRGASELTTQTTHGTPAATSGLDRDYITAWSYGIDETLTLMIANFKGGGSQENLLDSKHSDHKGYAELAQYNAQLQLNSLPQYWGSQPMTVGPVYAGAIVCFLALWALFLVRGALKWALLAATILSCLFAWGHNWMPVTDFFIDHLPMYAKFRTVSSALVIAEFTLPLLASLALAEILRNPSQILATRRQKAQLAIAAALSAGLCLVFAIAPSMADVANSNDQAFFDQLAQVGAPADFISGYRAALYTLRQSLLATDAWRSFWLIVSAIAIIVAYIKWHNKLPKWAVVAPILLITLVDMWNVDRRYLNNDSFAPEATRQEGFTKTNADKQILADKAKDYRVLNLATGNPFNETSNQTSYYHKSVGGYHAAKLHRYQDLIDRYLAGEVNTLNQAIKTAQERVMADSLNFAARGITDQATLTQAIVNEAKIESCTPILSMLNTRWIILSPEIAVRNTAAEGNAWFVSNIDFVATPDDEIAALAKNDLRHTAIVDKRWQAAAQTATLDSGSIVLDSYAPNSLAYTAKSNKGGVVVFSEIFYPGWTATIDGQPADLFRANYVLRALRLPPGQHKVELSFRPDSVATTSTIAYTAMGILVLGFGFALWRTSRKRNETTNA